MEDHEEGDWGGSQSLIALLSRLVLIFVIKYCLCYQAGQGIGKYEIVWTYIYILQEKADEKE